MSNYKNDVKCNITLKVIYDLTEKSQSNNINTSDIRKEVELKIELDNGIEFYRILESLLDDGYIQDDPRHPIKDLIKNMYSSTNAIVLITQKGVRSIKSQ